MTELGAQDSEARAQDAALTEGLTSWTLIEHAAGGSAAARSEFCRRYLPVVRNYLSSRWRGTPAARHQEDAVQEILLRCLRPDGLLQRADPSQGRGFQGFLYGLTRNVAREYEARDVRSALRTGPAPAEPDALSADEEGLSRVFDRAFARTVVREAAELLQARAQAGGEAARRRVEILRLRFEEGLAIRDIAQRWGADAARLHQEYRNARRDFEQALMDAASQHVPGRSPQALREYCEELLDLLA